MAAGMFPMMESAVEYRWEQKHILVVEDDESSAYLLGRILHATSAHVSFTTDGAEAVEYIRANPDTDLVLMDIHLPGKDGFTATREIKAISQKIIVIAQTSYSYSVERREADKAGCDAFFTKPIHPKLLLEKINGLIT
jgi:CheY-like chemotaxis protein